MDILASKFLYLADCCNLKEALNPFKGMPIQLAFFQKSDFFRMNHEAIKEICNDYGINIPTIHAPTIDVFNRDFMNAIKMIHDVYDVNVITIHPQKGDAVFAISEIKKHTKEIEELNIVLAYENFPYSDGKRKWISSPKEMYLKFELPFLKLTFDTSHIDSPRNCIEEFEAVSDKVAVVHLSDTDGVNQHQPLGSGIVPYKQFLRYLKDIDFPGFVVIEYMPEYITNLIADTNKLRAI